MYAFASRDLFELWRPLAAPFWAAATTFEPLTGLGCAARDAMVSALPRMIGHDSRFPPVIAEKRHAGRVACAMASDQELENLGRCLLASVGAAQWPFVTMPPLRPSWPPAAAMYDVSPHEHAAARRAFVTAAPVSTAELTEKARLIAFEAFVSAQLDRFNADRAVDVTEARRWCDALLLATPEDFVDALTSDLPLRAHQEELKTRGPADAPVALVCYVLSKAPPADRQALRRDTDRLRLAAP